jgi:hypothetical protein
MISVPVETPAVPADVFRGLFLVPPGYMLDPTLQQAQIASFTALSV